MGNAVCPGASHCIPWRATLWVFTSCESEVFQGEGGSPRGGEGYALPVVGSCCPDTGFTPGVNLSSASILSLSISAWPWVKRAMAAINTGHGERFCCLCGVPRMSTGFTPGAKKMHPPVADPYGLTFALPTPGEYCAPWGVLSLRTALIGASPPPTEVAPGRSGSCFTEGVASATESAPGGGVHVRVTCITGMKEIILCRGHAAYGSLCHVGERFPSLRMVFLVT